MSNLFDPSLIGAENPHQDEAPDWVRKEDTSQTLSISSSRRQDCIRTSDYAIQADNEMTHRDNESDTFDQRI
ncbi:hypothetical protein BLOT_011439 [Blomia tropicalis]|nr:hypothetical protein BLOT_011439 [Blomia tropicalis]